MFGNTSTKAKAATIFEPFSIERLNAQVNAQLMRFCKCQSEQDKEKVVLEQLMQLLFFLPVSNKAIISRTLFEAGLAFFNDPEHIDYAKAEYVDAFHRTITHLFPLPRFYHSSHHVAIWDYTNFFTGLNWSADYWFELWATHSAEVRATKTTCFSNTSTHSILWIMSSNSNWLETLLWKLNATNLKVLVQLYLLADSQSGDFYFSQQWLSAPKEWLLEQKRKQLLDDSAPLSLRMADIIHLATDIITAPDALVRLLKLFPEDYHRRLCAHYVKLLGEPALRDSIPKPDFKHTVFSEDVSQQVNTWYQAQLYATLSNQALVQTIPRHLSHELSMIDLTSGSSWEPIALCEAMHSQYERHSWFPSRESKIISEEFRQAYTAYKHRHILPSVHNQQRNLSEILAMVEYYQQKLKTLFDKHKTPEAAFESLANSSLYHYLNRLAIYFKTQIEKLPSQALFKRAVKLSHHVAGANSSAPGPSSSASSTMPTGSSLMFEPPREVVEDNVDLNSADILQYSKES